MVFVTALISNNSTFEPVEVIYQQANDAELAFCAITFTSQLVSWFYVSQFIVTSSHGCSIGSLIT